MHTDQSKDFAQFKKFGDPATILQSLTLLEQYKRHGTPEEIEKAYSQIKVVLGVVKESGLMESLKILDQKIYGGKHG